MFKKVLKKVDMHIYSKTYSLQDKSFFKTSQSFKTPKLYLSFDKSVSEIDQINTIIYP